MLFVCGLYINISSYFVMLFVCGSSSYFQWTGPVPASVPDFWRMVWEQGSATIVMLTNLEERGRVRAWHSALVVQVIIIRYFIRS